MLVEQGTLRPFDAADARQDAADAGQRARGHRQPGRPARRLRPGGAAGRRRGRHAVLAGRGRRGDGRATDRVDRAVAAPAGAAGPRPRAAGARRWPGRPSTGSATCWSGTSATSGCRAPSGCARHERTADWLDTVAADRDTDLAEVLAHHRWTAHEIARTLGLDAHRYAEPARDALHRAARRAYALHALEFAAAYAGRALGLCDERANPLERLRSSCSATEIAFYSRQRRVPGRRRRRAARHARRPALRGRRPGLRGPGLDAARAGRLAAGRPASTALSCLDRAVELFDEPPDGSGQGRGVRRAGPPAHAQHGDRAGHRRRHGGRRDRRPARPGRARDQRPDHHGRRRTTSPATATACTSCTRSSTSAASTACSPCAGPCRTSPGRCARRATGPARTRCSPRGCRPCRGGHNLATGYSAVVQHVLLRRRLADARRRGRGGRRQPGRRVGPAGAAASGPGYGCCVGDARPGPGRRTARRRAAQRLPPPALDRARPRRALPGLAGPVHRGRSPAGRTGEGLARRPRAGQRRVDRRDRARRVPGRPLGRDDRP